VRSDLGPALDVRGGFREVLFRGAKGSRIEIGVVAEVTAHSSANARDEYSLSFSLLKLRNIEERAALARQESFKFKRTSRQGRRITINGGQVEIVDEQSRAPASTRSRELLRSDSLGLATLPRLSDDEGGRQVSEIAELFATFRVVEIDVPAARSPALLRSAVELDSDASNLSAFLLRLREESPEAFARLVEDARAFVPGLADLHFMPVGGADEAVVLEIEENWLPGRTRLADASFGTVRALALLAVLYDPNPPRLTCMEEIDHGLHPYVFDRLVDRLREASERTQFLLATHSPALVSRLTTKELIVCERNSQGASVIPAITETEMDRIQEAVEDKLNLGELWFSGTLGGVPE
jgi:predicted ATPase